MDLIDLHVHSTISDGTFTPEELVAYAHSKGLRAIALTDHDTVNGVKACVLAGQKLNIEVIPGIEFSGSYANREVHILGYYIDFEHPEFLAKLNSLILARGKRNTVILEKLAKQGFLLTQDDIHAVTPEDAVLTRAHIAMALFNKGYIQERSEAFSRYIGEGCPCYVPKACYTAKECIDLIHQAGGIAVLAHPMLYRYSRSEITQVIGTLKKEGLDGVECLYSTHTQDDTHHLLQVCRNLSLLPTGGSDFHGSNKAGIDLGTGYGKLAIPYDFVEGIKAHLGLL